MKKIILSLLLLATLSACEYNVKPDTRYVDAVHGQVYAGMEYRHVRQALGEPDEVTHTLTELHGIVDQWVYYQDDGTTIYVWFRNRTVATWRKQ